MKKQTPTKKRRTRRCAAAGNARDAGASATPSIASASPPSSPAPPTATDKQDRFVAEYLIDLNAAAAARRAGYTGTRSDQAGYELLRKPEIAQAIADGKARQMAAADLSAVRVLEELRRLAFVNARDFWNADGTVKTPMQLTAEQGACLAGFDVQIKNLDPGDGHTDLVHKFRLWDKVRSLEMLAKHFELLVDRVKVDTTSADARVARLVAARKRVAK